LIRRVACDQRAQHLSDHDLLRHFEGQRDEAAFHALLLRHGPMVLEVCRGVLANEADAEDAFQAAFLILASKARAIRKGASVEAWLHGVAYRTALKARAQLAKRQKHETGAPARPISVPDDLTWLIDYDSKFARAFDAVFAAEGAKVQRVGPRGRT
jgi:DNA-directed RNA polymerase specialized sigma24 family protein